MAQSVRWSLSALLCVVLFVPAAAQEKRLRTFVDALEQPVLSDPQLSPDGTQIAFVDRPRGLEGQPPHRPHLSHQRRRHQPGAADVRRARRVEPALVARRQVDRVHRAARPRHQQPDLPAERRRRRSPPHHHSCHGAGEPDLGAGRQVDLLHRHRRQVRRGARARSRAGRCVFVRGEQFQAASPVDDGSRRQDDAAHRRRLVGERLRAERRRQAHRDAAHAEPAARIHRSHRSVGDGCRPARTRSS